jgi:hypothetical protein
VKNQAQFIEYIKGTVNMAVKRVNRGIQGNYPFNNLLFIQRTYDIIPAGWTFLFETGIRLGSRVFFVGFQRLEHGIAKGNHEGSLLWCNEERIPLATLTSSAEHFAKLRGFKIPVTAIVTAKEKQKFRDEWPKYLNGVSGFKERSPEQIH